MSRPARLFDLLFYLTAGASIAVALVLFLTGCGSWSDIVSAATQPTANGTLLSEAIQALPTVVAEPVNYLAWAKIAGLLGAVGLAVLGVRKATKGANA